MLKRMFKSLPNGKPTKQVKLPDCLGRCTFGFELVDFLTNSMK